MHRLQGKFHWLRLAIAPAALWLLPVMAVADPPYAGNASHTIEWTWSAPLTPVDAVPVDSVEPMPLAIPDEFFGESFASSDPEPGLQVSLNPDDEELVVGWRFAF